MSLLLQVRNLSKKFMMGQKVISILEDLSLDIHKGDMISIQGVSGIGKTTLLNILGLLDESYDGDLVHKNISLRRMSSIQKAHWRNKKIGFVFQFFQLLKGLNVLENVMLPQLISRKPFSEAHCRAIEILDHFGLMDRINHFPSELSGGEQQRIALARAIVNKPDLLLLDEPTGNLDETTSVHIESLIKKIYHDFSMTLVTVTHNKNFSKMHTKQYILSQKKLSSLLE